MSCTSSCPTPGRHPSYGACLRAKHIATTGLESTGPGFATNEQKAWDSELDRYADAVRQGLQPASTKTRDIDLAVEASNETGVPYRADAPPITAAEAMGNG